MNTAVVAGTDCIDSALAWSPVVGATPMPGAGGRTGSTPAVFFITYALCIDAFRFVTAQVLEPGGGIDVVTQMAQLA